MKKSDKYEVCPNENCSTCVIFKTLRGTGRSEEEVMELLLDFSGKVVITYLRGQKPRRGSKSRSMFH